jgi:hypothetical protein
VGSHWDVNSEEKTVTVESRERKGREIKKNQGMVTWDGKKKNRDLTRSSMITVRGVKRL